MEVEFFPDRCCILWWVIVSRLHTRLKKITYDSQGVLWHA